MSTARRRLASLVIAALAAAACGDAETISPRGDGATTSTGAGGAGGGGGAGPGGAGGAAPASLDTPQLVHGVGYLDRLAFPRATLVVEANGAGADALDAVLDDDAALPTTKEGRRFFVDVDAASLAPGRHTVTLAATRGGADAGRREVTLVVGDGSLQWTRFDDVGPAAPAGIARDAGRDRLALTWWSVAGGDRHRAWLAHVDGGFDRITPDDVLLSDPADDALGALTTFAGDAIGVVYRTPRPGAPHWGVRMRVVDHDGQVVVPTQDLTGGDAAFAPIQIGHDPSGVSAAWLHIPAPAPGGPAKPLEIRFARWDLVAGALTTITVDTERPAPAGSAEGPLELPTLAEIGLACNAAVCVVTYSREVYDELVELDIPKLFRATVDLASGALAGPPRPVDDTTWATQMFGHHLVAEDDGTFVLVYTANDTEAALTPKSACDETMERDLLYAVRLDAAGAPLGAPRPIFDHEGTREMPRVAAHPAGYALFWEDQRSHCGPDGHIAMAMNVAAPDLASLLDPYLEAPGSRVLPPEAPAIAVVGTSFVHAWSDNRHGNGLVDIRPEVYLDTYWRR